MEDKKKYEIIRAALESAINGLSEKDISQNVIQEALRLKDDTNILHITTRETTVKIDTVFGSAIYVKDAGPTWVEYKDHRGIDEWEWIIDQAKEKTQ